MQPHASGMPNKQRERRNYPVLYRSLPEVRRMVEDSRGKTISGDHWYSLWEGLEEKYPHHPLFIKHTKEYKETQNQQIHAGKDEAALQNCP